LAVSILNEVAFHPERPIPPIARGLPSEATGDAAARATLGCGPHSFYPPIYYLSSAIGYSAARERPLLPRLYASRLASVIWGALGSVAAFFLGYWLLGSVSDGLLLGLLVTLQPMVGFLSAVVNSDSAVLACSTCCFASIAAIYRNRDSKGALIALALFATLGTMSKLTFTILAPIFFLLCLVVLGARRPRAWLLSAATFLPFLLATLWWSVHSSGGTADRLSGAPRALGAGEFVKSWVLIPARLKDLWINQYWMSWGWADTTLAKSYYQLLAAAGIMALIGVALGWRRFTPRGRWSMVVVATWTVILIILLFAIEYTIVRDTGEPGFVQGRYILPLFPAHAVIMVVGLRELCLRFKAKLDGAWALASMLAIVNVAAICSALLRYYHA
jgi:4-amino-4-deoxy-L-arabinose transferase-like glycosyltransferase